MANVVDAIRAVREGTRNVNENSLSDNHMALMVHKFRLVHSH